MSGHIEQLTEWWENAEDGAPRPGDKTITRDYGHGGVAYAVSTWHAARVYDEGEDRVLERAPKPKPAWHDAPAIIATATDSDGDEFTGVWTLEGGSYWLSEEGHTVHRAYLRDVTPLIEAKVTDEMIDRAFRSNVVSHLSERELRELLTDVLGIETT